MTHCAPYSPTLHLLYCPPLAVLLHETHSVSLCTVYVSSLYSLLYASVISRLLHHEAAQPTSSDTDQQMYQAGAGEWWGDHGLLGGNG